MSIYGSASAIICWGEKILLFLRDDIPTIPYPDYWALPGGGVEAGETPLEAMKRELFEEVTHIPNHIEHLLTIKAKNKTTTVYISFVDDNEAKLFLHKPEEGQRIAFFTLQEMEQLKLPPHLKGYFSRFKSEFANTLATRDIANLKSILENNL